MELDLQSLYGLHVHSCTHWLRPRNPTPANPRIWANIRSRALLVSQDNDISLWLLGAIVEGFYSTRVPVPSSELGPPTLSPPANVSPPWTQRRGATLSCRLGGGGTQVGRQDRKPGTLDTLRTLPLFSFLVFLSWGGGMVELPTFKRITLEISSDPNSKRRNVNKN